MRRVVKAAAFIVSSFLFLLLGIPYRLVVRFAGRPWEPAAARLCRFWASLMLRILEITVSVRTPEHQPLSGGVLSVSNHLGYLDIIVIASLRPTLFVAKRDVRSWPLLGRLAQLGGTVFVDRAAFRGAHEASQEVSVQLRGGRNVHIFPEGTSTDGSSVLPFRPSLFSAAVQAGAAVVPMTLRYGRVNDEPVSPAGRDRVHWYGDMTFASHFWSLLACHGIVAELTVHPPLDETERREPRTASVAAFAAVRSAFVPLPPKTRTPSPEGDGVLWTLTDRPPRGA